MAGFVRSVIIAKVCASQNISQSEVVEAILNSPLLYRKLKYIIYL
jgi:hypothetical protein